MSIPKLSRKLMVFTMSALAIGVILVTGNSLIDRDIAETAFAAEFGYTSSAPVLLAKGSVATRESSSGSQGTDSKQSTGQRQISGDGQNQNSGDGQNKPAWGYGRGWCYWHPYACYRY